MQLINEHAAQSAVTESGDTESAQAAHNQETGFRTAALSTFKLLLVERHGPLLIVRINRPAKKNALNRLFYFELMRVLSWVRYENAISMVVLTAVGDDYFSSGVDLLQSQDYPNKAEFQRSSPAVFRQLVRVIVNCPKVLVALVNGPCLGVGCTLVGLFDIVYCTEKARFETPFSRIGICAEGGSSYTFPRAMNKSLSTEMLLFGVPLTATEAVRCGFAARLYKGDEVEKLFWPQMTAYAAMSSESLRVSKRLLRAREREALLAAVNEELAEVAVLQTRPAYKQAIEEFVERSLRRQENKKSKL